MKKFVFVLSIFFLTCSITFASSVYTIGKVKSTSNSKITVIIPFSKCKGTKTITISNPNSEIHIGQVIHLFFKDSCDVAKIKEAPN